AQHLFMRARSKKTREVQVKPVHPHPVTRIMYLVKTFPTDAAHHVRPAASSFLSKGEKTVVVPIAQGWLRVRTDSSVIHAATKPMRVDITGSSDGVFMHARESTRQQFVVAVERHYPVTLGSRDARVAGRTFTAVFLMNN